MKGFKIIAILLFLGALYVSYKFYLRQGYIIKIFQNTEWSENSDLKCKSTVILVKDAPFSQFSLKKMWLRHSKDILKKWNPLNSDCDDILFISNKTSSPNYRSELNYWMGDNYICLNGMLGNEQCLSKEQQLFILQLRTSTLDDEKIGSVDGKPIYIHFIDY